MAGDNILLKYDADIKALKARLLELEKGNKGISDSAKKAGKDMTDSFSGASGAINNSLRSIATGVAAAFSIAAIKQFLGASIDAFAKAESQTNALRFALEKVGKQGSDAFDKLIKQSKELAESSFFDDEDIQQAQSMLATIGLTTDEIKKLTPQILDLATRQGTDLVSATEKAIAAINGQTRSLKDVGANFDDTGSKVGNLNELYKQLAPLAGSAADALETGAGAMRKQDVEAENLQESIGEKLIPIYNSLRNAALNAAEGVLRLFGLVNEKSNTQLAKDALKDLTEANIEAAKALSDDAIAKKIALNKDLIKTVADDIERIFKTSQDLNKDQGILQLKESNKKAYEEENAGLQSILDSRKNLNDFNEKFPLSLTGLTIAELQGQIKELEKTSGISSTVIDDYIEARKKAIEAIKKAQDAANTQALKDATEQRKKEQQIFTSPIDKIDPGKGSSGDLRTSLSNSPNVEYLKELARRADETRGKIIELNDEFLAAIPGLTKDFIDELFSFADNDFEAELDRINEIHNTQMDAFDAEAEALEKKNERGAISDRAYQAEKDKLLAKRKKAEADFAAQEKKIKNEQANAEWQKAIFDVISQTAVAIMKAAPNIPLQIATGILGSLQLANVVAHPPPKFAKGTRFLDDPRAPHGTDTILMYGDRGERIIDKEMNRKFREHYDAIDSGNYSRFIEKKYVTPALLDFKKRSEERSQKSFAENVAGSLYANFNGLTANEAKRIASKGQVINNADEIAYKIAQNIAPFIQKSYGKLY